MPSPRLRTFCSTQVRLFATHADIHSKRSPRERTFDAVCMAMQAKLHRLDQQHHLFTPEVKTVIDVGYAPGNWSQYSKFRLCDVHRIEEDKFNDTCHLLGVDILFSTPPVKGMSCIQGNIFSKLTHDIVARHIATFNQPVDLILSDLGMPFSQLYGFYSNTISRPHMRLNTNKALQKPMTDVNVAAANLAEASYFLSRRVLRLGGSLVVRMGRLTKAPPRELRDKLENEFGDVVYERDHNDHIFVCKDKVTEPPPLPSPWEAAKL
ncbi:hypothetical protein DIURU_004566 [Diutina rugosa]|uniref:rRNA methyltransferase 2, mitochondrial n=1 Tax=Diutina rugosa TaxID=5481 RepID=A0A642UH01_DIURU|nr:uncharacterized protein DIURU_004566 [Diutina rugosa]KAA8898722.1 hypothetical protein DIURU_004566 [Diutina rugosa]